MSSTSEQRIDDLIAANRPMAQRLARRYSHGAGVDPDLAQVAYVGLFLAASRYEPATGPFRPYAMATIVGELKKHLRSNGWTVKVPRRLQEATIAVSTATEELEQHLKRSPTPAEIAKQTGLSEENVIVALQARNARFSAEPPAIDPAIHTDFDRVADTIDVREAAAKLPHEHQELLTLRFQGELTQRQIAERFDISQSQVHRRLAAILDDLRDAFDSERQDDP